MITNVQRALADFDERFGDERDDGAFDAIEGCGD
jgi:hypothetical protein